MKESDLYTPLKRFLEAQKYQVKGEVHNCDVVAIREKEEPVIVELKLSLNLTVLLQAVERLSLSAKVYVCVPRQCKVLKKQRRHIIKLLRMLGLGLILISPDNSRAPEVQVLLDPNAYIPRKSKPRQQRLLGEFAKRVGDPNLGGIEKRNGIVTAYRQRTLRIAKHLQAHGPIKSLELANILQEPKARDILYRNVYGWFERVSRGVYELSPRGEREISKWAD